MTTSMFNSNLIRDYSKNKILDNNLPGLKNSMPWQNILKIRDCIKWQGQILKIGVSSSSQSAMFCWLRISAFTSLTILSKPPLTSTFPRKYT